MPGVLCFLQVSKQSRAHVLLASSEGSFIAWLTESGYLDFNWLVLTLLRMLSFLGATAELGSQASETQVIGNFPEAEAHLYFEQTMGTSITDADWACSL